MVEKNKSCWKDLDVLLTFFKQYYSVDYPEIHKDVLKTILFAAVKCGEVDHFKKMLTDVAIELQADLLIESKTKDALALGSLPNAFMLAILKKITADKRITLLDLLLSEGQDLSTELLIPLADIYSDLKKEKKSPLTELGIKLNKSIDPEKYVRMLV